MVVEQKENQRISCEFFDFPFVFLNKNIGKYGNICYYKYMASLR